MPATYDFIFAGGGMSALLLATLIRREPTLDSCSILIVEPRTDVPESKNICFWDSQLPDLSLNLKGAWNKLSFGGTGGLITRPIAPYTYYCFDAANLQRTLTAMLKKSNRVDFIQDRVEAVNNGAVFLQKTGLTFQATQTVFDSIPDRSMPVLLWQHFVGWEIRVLNEVTFDPASAMLMDFRVSQSEGPAFMYILPFSQKTALLEITFMSPKTHSATVYEHYLHEYLHKNFPDIRYEIAQTEGGKIPMHQAQQSPSLPNHVFLGTKGGLSKPTTGYTFLNSYEHAQRIVRQLTGNQESRVIAKSRFAFYDKLLLRIMRTQATSVKPIMEALFYRNSFPLLLTFLAEKTTLIQEAKLFCTLPWKPFLTALAHEYLRRSPRNEAQSGIDSAILPAPRLKVDRNLG
ncbi:lycopene cyclase family protein [Arundinibacter roseus]|uniref:Lycopene cyclase n=1 Tax=Arundinibacter roseus TaxID=2070510 RepID=A0A4R4KGE3_9BACT|nr:lycopene cyclase family protein [Arundinibacter roseus]TDB65936.1 hypothetical protein EZE20_09230 [Arundinibacter roseus]